MAKQVSNPLPVLIAAGLSAEAIRSFLLHASRTPGWEVKFAEKLLDVIRSFIRRKAFVRACWSVSWNLLRERKAHGERRRAVKPVAGFSRSKPCRKKPAKRYRT